MMKLERLGNVIKIISGSPFDSAFFNENKEGMPLIRVRDVNSGFAGIYYSGKYEDTFLINDGDLLIGLDGDFKCVEWKYGKALLNQRVCKIIPIEGLASRDYILHFLPQALNEIHRNTNFTTVKHLSTKTINEIKIPLQSLSNQIHLAEILSQAESLIAQRKESIKLLDELLKSTFLEMFGDPVRNEKGWETVYLDKISAFENGDRSSNYPSGDDIIDEGVLFINSSNIVDFRFKPTNPNFISQEKFDSLRSGRCLKGDIIFTLRGNGLGKCCVFEGDYEKGFVNAQIVIIRPYPNLNNHFLIEQFRNPSIFQNIWKLGTGSAQPQLSVAKLKKLKIIHPPLELQTKFAAVIEKVKVLKYQYQQSLKELQNMYCVLSQNAFKGELKELIK